MYRFSNGAAHRTHGPAVPHWQTAGYVRVPKPDVRDVGESPYRARRVTTRRGSAGASFLSHPCSLRTVTPHRRKRTGAQDYREKPAIRPPVPPSLFCKEMFIFSVSFRHGSENSQVMYNEFYLRPCSMSRAATRFSGLPTYFLRHRIRPARKLRLRRAAALMSLDEQLRNWPGAMPTALRRHVLPTESACLRGGDMAPGSISDGLRR